MKQLCGGIIQQRQMQVVEQLFKDVVVHLCDLQRSFMWPMQLESISNYNEIKNVLWVRKLDPRPLQYRKSLADIFFVVVETHGHSGFCVIGIQ